ncbi:helix-turn-helix domain-containing protein [Cytophaga hutchinsonii]|uniref:Transcriptional regulator, AraC family n=1 Tax=Cytophaga hutchinsonii (strain ATCC 33406 / DSM 1761 / CIP 103989 / NBRC 15051 / NCIMB 9469 / D465) TaxID=269798 RepID=A0A6N4SNY3_CYTH3|nr:helix-turn-helix domain-containing protein [Cytophaga hutchinsonii]ABG57989.1 transcriptional regulator, AraC family [Cytophaga hutchinsonii ATCC 33406]SFX10804.1 transcriptional regulator, AraC family [Cytophaga hutchinsonii ATCC 33406]
MKHKPEHIPVYSIDKFSKKTADGAQYNVEIFNKDRDFKVAYPHRHDDFYEILFITKGTGTYIIDLQEYEIKPNTVFFLSPGQIHEISFSPDIYGYIFLFSSGFYLSNKNDPYKLFEFPFFYSLQYNNPPLYLTKASAIEELDSLFKKAILEVNTDALDSQEATHALLDLILIQCKRLYPQADGTQLKKGHILIKRFKQLIEEKCTENIGVKEYADMLHVTANHLSETVKEFTGRTPTDFINDRMTLEIKRLLTHTQLTVQEIAFQLHFSDQSYFSKYFKKTSGVSPTEYRKIV